VAALVAAPAVPGCLAATFPVFAGAPVVLGVLPLVAVAEPEVVRGVLDELLPLPELFPPVFFVPVPFPCDGVAL